MFPSRWRNSWLLMTALTGLLLASCKTSRPTSPARSASEDTGGPLMKEQAAYDVQHYDLSLRVDPKKKYISGHYCPVKVLLTTMSAL